MEVPEVNVLLSPLVEVYAYMQMRNLRMLLDSACGEDTWVSAETFEDSSVTQNDDWAAAFTPIPAQPLVSKETFNRCILRWNAFQYPSLPLLLQPNRMDHNKCHNMPFQTDLSDEVTEKSLSFRAYTCRNPNNREKARQWFQKDMEKGIASHFRREVAARLPCKQLYVFNGKLRPIYIKNLAFTVLLFIRQHSDKVAQLAPGDIFPLFEWCLRSLCYGISEASESPLVYQKISDTLSKFKKAFYRAKNGIERTNIFIKRCMDICSLYATTQSTPDTSIDKADSSAAFFNSPIFKYEGYDEFLKRDCNKTRKHMLFGRRKDLWYKVSTEIMTIQAYLKPLVELIYGHDIQAIYERFLGAAVKANTEIRHLREYLSSVTSDTILHLLQCHQTEGSTASDTNGEDLQKPMRTFSINVEFQDRELSPQEEQQKKMDPCSGQTEGNGSDILMPSLCHQEVRTSESLVGWHFTEAGNVYYVIGGVESLKQILPEERILGLTFPRTSFFLDHAMVLRLWSRFYLCYKGVATEPDALEPLLSIEDPTLNSYEKLRTIRSIGNRNALRSFAESVFCLTCRYVSLCDPANDTGTGLQCAIPSELMRYLRENFQVNCECFASPFNAVSTNYYSAFADIDYKFGSRGKKTF